MRDLTDKPLIADIMWLWYHDLIEAERYHNYLLGIRDNRIWIELDSLCGYDMVTAVKIAEMQ